MQKDTEVMYDECVIKVEPEQFESTVFIQQTTKPKNSVAENKNIAETEAAYIKVEESDPFDAIPIVKLEPQVPLEPVVVLKRLTKSIMQKWTMYNNPKFKATGRLNCDACGKFFAQRYTMELHLKIHFKSPHLFCDLCPKSFRDKRGLQIHMTSHLPNKPFTCRKCGFGTIYKNSLLQHLALHREKLIECPICQKMVTVLKNHIKHTHDYKDKQVQCEVCLKTMVIHKLARHTNMVHAANRECPKCKEKFNTRGLRIHMLRAHYKGIIHECSECDAVFKHNFALETHRKTHMTTKFGGGKCGVCSREYPREDSLKRHWYHKHHASMGSFITWKENNKMT